MTAKLTDAQYRKRVHAIHGRKLRPTQPYVSLFSRLEHKCSRGHVWKTQPAVIVHQKSGCPLCKGRGLSLKHRLQTGKKIVGSCWIWTGSKNKDGYGLITLEGKSQHLHRVAYRFFIGGLRKDRLVCHKCDVPACFNPKHLFLGTHKQNRADCVEKGRARTRTKLNAVKVRRIRRFLAQGQSTRWLGQKFSVNASTIRAIATGRTWRHV